MEIRRGRVYLSFRPILMDLLELAWRRLGNDDIFITSTDDFFTWGIFQIGSEATPWEINVITGGH